MRLIKPLKRGLWLSAWMTLVGCSSSNWHSMTLPSDKAVEASLEASPVSEQILQTESQTFTLARMPEAIRPCCAFGNAQRVRIGSLIIPYFRYANTVGINDLGAHGYEAGTLSLQRPKPTSRRSSEGNGQMYTLRGGFIDIAHVRDTADNAIALYQRIYPQLGQAQVIELPYEIGPREIRLKAFDSSMLNPQQRRELAAHLATWLAYSMAEAHELAQWHGYRSWRPWSESVSAYSPEDIYSNMLGAKIAYALLINELASNRDIYNTHMTQWLKATLQSLEPVSVKQSNMLFDAVDGLWWDSSVAMPSKFMLLKRHYAMGNQQSPHLVTEEIARAHPAWAMVEDRYASAPPALTLALPETVHGFELKQLAEQWLVVDSKFAASFAHIPSELWIDGFNQESFGTIAGYNRQQDERELKAWQETR